MFRFIKKAFIGLLSVCKIGSFGESLVSDQKGLIKSVSLNNYLCQARPTLVNRNSEKTFFYLFNINVNKCGGSFNTINDPRAPVCVPNKMKDMNAKLFHLMSGVNETKFLVKPESWECKCRFDESICIKRKKWNHNECKKLDDWGFCKNDYMWNPTKHDYECNKACRINEYLDIKNCSYETRLIGNFITRM